MPDDGVSVVPTPTTGTEEPKMAEAVDLPQNVASHLMTETVGNIQANNLAGRNIATTANGVLQAAMARNFDELGTVESRATSGVMATPIASPTTQEAQK
jgi:hypothetical protein